MLRAFLWLPPIFYYVHPYRLRAISVLGRIMLRVSAVQQRYRHKVFHLFITQQQQRIEQAQHSASLACNAAGRNAEFAEHFVNCRANHYWRHAGLLIAVVFPYFCLCWTNK